MQCKEAEVAEKVEKQKKIW